MGENLHILIFVLGEERLHLGFDFLCGSENISKRFFIEGLSHFSDKSN
jgi:hypothetical protein